MGNYVDSFGLKRVVGRGEGTCKEYDISAKPAEGMTNFLEVLVNGVLPVAGELRKDQARLPKGAVVKEVVLVSRKGNLSGITVNAVKEDGSSAEALASALAANEGEAKSVEVEDKTFAEDRYIACTGTVADDDYASILVKFI